MASAARRPEGFVRSNRREGSQTRDAPSGLEVGFCSAACLGVPISSNAVSQELHSTRGSNAGLSLPATLTITNASGDCGEANCLPLRFLASREDYARPRGAK